MPTTVSIRSELRVGAEHQLYERAGVVVGRGRVLPDARPPEDVLKVVQASPHLLQGGSAEIEEDVGVPARDLRGPLRPPGSRNARRAPSAAETAARSLRGARGACGPTRCPRACRIPGAARCRCGTARSTNTRWPARRPGRTERSMNGFLGNSSSPRPRYPRSCSSLTCCATSGASSSTYPNGRICVGYLRAASATTLRCAKGVSMHAVRLQLVGDPQEVVEEGRNLLVEVKVHVHDPVRCGGVGRGRRWCGSAAPLRAHHAQGNSGARGGEKVPA